MNTIKKWQADIDVQAEHVKQCLLEQFPRLLPLNNIRLIGEGWDNRVFLVNENVIFRFPRRKIAVELFEHENRVLPQLQSHFSLQIPNPIYQGKPSEYYPYPFQGYTRLQGTSGENLSQENRLASLKALSLFLKQLHAITKKQALHLGAESQVFDKTQVQQAITTFKERVNQLISLDCYDINSNEINNEVEKIQTIELSNSLSLVHGDLHFKHLLFNHGKLTSVIDWGDLGINHPVVDLSIIWGFYSSEYHSIFHEIYGFVDQKIWNYARFLALYVAFTFLLYGQDIGNEKLVNEAIQSIRRINPKLLDHE
ncbi:MAG: phosphotransferase [Cellulomonas sp.]|nr:phosphotransferase [Rickettsiella sp.]